MIKPDLGWELWRSFLAVADEGSLSGAARLLRLTQPTIGRHIDQLEEDLGAPLFTRSQQGLRPTALALSLVPEARTMQAAALNLRRLASGEAEGETGTVRLAASEIVGVEVLPPVLAEFRRAHPAIAIELALSNRNEDLLRRDADIAVRMVRPQQGALVARHLGRVGIGLYAHETYVARRGLPETAADLARHDMIGVDRNEAALAGITIGGHPARAALFSFRTDSDVAQLAAIRAGLGIGVCQHGIARRDEALRPVLPSTLRFDLDMWLAMHEDLRYSRRIRLLFDHLAAGLSAYVETSSME